MFKKIFIIIIILIEILLFINCKKESKIRKINLHELENVSIRKEDVEVKNQNENTFFKIAIAPVISPKNSLFLYKDFIKYIEKKIDQPVEILQSDNYSDINELIKSSLCDIAFICAGTYILSKKNMQLLVLPIVKGQSIYFSYIITHKNKNIKNFSELEGKSFAFTDPLSLSGFLYPKYLIKQKNKTIREYFSKVIFTHSHDASIQAIKQEIVDGAAVDSLVFNKLVNDGILNSDDITIIHKSPPFGISPVVVRNDLDYDKILKLRKIFIDMNKDTEGKYILQKIGIDKFILPEEDIYEDLKWLNNE